MFEPGGVRQWLWKEVLSNPCPEVTSSAWPIDYTVICRQLEEADNSDLGAIFGVIFYIL